MKRILVVLPNWYGETLFATPLLRALRRQCPQAFIATLGWPQCREVLQGNPSVDLLLDFDERGAHRGWLAQWRLAKLLRAHHFDTAFILRRSLTRTILAALAGIPARIGTANRKSGWLLTHRAKPAAAGRHKAAAYVPLLESVGLHGSADGFDYVVGEAERAEARERLRAAGLLDGRAVVILHPGANWFHKRWPPERFAALGDRLAAQPQTSLVISGGPDDVPLAESIRRSMRSPATVVAGQTTLRQLAALLEQAALIISNDTGISHLAAALHRPLLALYGPTSPSLTGPLGDARRMIVLHHPDCCPRIPCFSPDRPPHPGMASISVEEAYAAAIKLLEQKI